MPKPCSKCGKSLEKVQKCSRCRCAYYCSVECQKKHWKIHKASCNQVSSGLNFIIKQSNGMKQSFDYMIKNTPGKDLLKLSLNEGESYERKLRILSIGFCDLADVIVTIAALPPHTSADLEFHLIDFSPFVCSRTAILLLLLQQMVQAWENKTGYRRLRRSFFLIWYSMTLSEQDFTQLTNVLSKFSTCSGDPFVENSFVQVELVGTDIFQSLPWTCSMYLNCNWDKHELLDAQWNMRGRVSKEKVLDEFDEINKNKGMCKSVEDLLWTGSIHPSHLQTQSVTQEENGNTFTESSMDTQTPVELDSIPVDEILEEVFAAPIPAPASDPSAIVPSLASDDRLSCVNSTFLTPVDWGIMVYANPPLACPLLGWAMDDVEAYGKQQDLWPNLHASFISYAMEKIDKTCELLFTKAQQGSPISFFLCNDQIKNVKEYPLVSEGFDRIYTSNLPDHVGGIEAVLKKTRNLLNGRNRYSTILMDIQNWQEHIEGMDSGIVEGVMDANPSRKLQNHFMNEEMPDIQRIVFEMMSKNPNLSLEDMKKDERITNHIMKSMSKNQELMSEQYLLSQFRAYLQLTFPNSNPRKKIVWKNLKLRAPEKNKIVKNRPGSEKKYRCNDLYEFTLEWVQKQN